MHNKPLQYYLCTIKITMHINRTILIMHNHNNYGQKHTIILLHIKNNYAECWKSVKLCWYEVELQDDDALFLKNRRRRERI